MSKSCKLPDCYPTSFNSYDFDDSFQNVNSEATFYSLDFDGNEMDSVSLNIGSYDNDSLNAVGINPSGIYRIDIPSNMNVTLFSENNFEGDSEIFYSNTSNLVDRENGISSLVIRTGSEPSESDIITTPRIAPSSRPVVQMPSNSVPPSIINSNIISNKVLPPPVNNNVSPLMNNVIPPPMKNYVPSPSMNNIVTPPLINSNIVTPPPLINSNIVTPPMNNYVSKALPPVITDSKKELAVTNSVITSQMKSERWINGISNTTIVIIIFILLLIIILKK